MCVALYCVFVAVAGTDDRQYRNDFRQDSGSERDGGPAATVSIKNDLTGAVTSVAADATGRFSAPGLPVGTYTIEVAVPGFTTARSAGLLLTASGLENVAISLKVAPLNQEVTVSEFVPLAAVLAPSQSSLDTHS